MTGILELEEDEQLEETMLRRGNDGRLFVIVDDKAVAVWLRQCFPWSERHRHLSLRDMEDREVVLIEDLIQTCVERMGDTARQVLSRHPHRRLLRPPSSFAHRHRRQCKTCDRSCRSLFVHGSIGRLA